MADDCHFYWIKQFTELKKQQTLRLCRCTKCCLESLFTKLYVYEWCKQSDQQGLSDKI